LSSAIKNILKFLLFLGVGVALVYLSVRGITPEERTNIIQAFEQANYFWVALSLLVGISSHFLRAVRWRMLIEPIDRKPRLVNAFFAIMIGYMANYAVPRLGEVSRCGVLARYEKMSFTEILGTVIVERVIDVLMLILFFIIMLVIESKKAFEMINEIDLMGKLNAWLHSHVIIMTGLLVILGIGIIIILKSKNKLLTIIKKYVQSFWLGIKSVGKVKRPFLFWVYSVGIWMLYLMATYLCFFCFAGTSALTLGDGLVILIVGSVAVIITPGGTGAFQLLIASVLVAVYPNLHLKESGLSVALPWLIWGSQLILIVFLGLISLVLLPIINKNDKTGVHTV
jgi:glycosyltransferase 2 family protein